MILIEQDQAYYLDGLTVETSRNQYNQVINSLIPYLSDRISLKNVTFRNLLSFIERDADLFERIYCSLLGNNPLQLWLDEAYIDADNKYESLLVSWDDEYDFTVIHGINEEQIYIIDLCPLKNFVNVEIDLGDKPMRVFDVLYAIFDALGMHGTPSQRDERREELNRRINSITESTQFIPADQLLINLQTRIKTSGEESDD